MELEKVWYFVLICHYLHKLQVKLMLNKDGSLTKFLYKENSAASNGLSKMNLNPKLKQEYKSITTWFPCLKCVSPFYFYIMLTF